MIRAIPKRFTGGEGIQHIALRVDNLEAAVEELKAKGVRLIDEKPRRGRRFDRLDPSKGNRRRPA